LQLTVIIEIEMLCGETEILNSNFASIMQANANDAAG
jgi:hypothetical protein